MEKAPNMDEDAAAVKMQSMVRGRAARATVAKAHAEEEQAAVKMQSMIRGRSSRAKQKESGPPPSAKLVGAISADRYGMNTALESQPTAEMRAELMAKGVELPDDAALTELSQLLNTWIEEYMYKHNKVSHTWFNLFAEVDKDGSGFVTYDEMYHVVRFKLEKGPKLLGNNKIKALWCALDADDSNSIQKDEMAGFFKRGAIEKKKNVATKRENTSAVCAACNVHTTSLTLSCTCPRAVSAIACAR